MAVVNYEEADIGIGGIKLFKWPLLANGDTGTPLRIPNYADVTVHVEGTFSVGGNCIIEGTLMNEASPTFATLNDVHGTALATITAEIIHSIAENVWEIRPRISAGDGSTAIDVWLMAFTPARRA